MLRVILCTEVKLTSEDIKRFEQNIAEAGGKPIAVFTERLPSISEFFECNPEVVIAGGGEPVSLIWSFLLYLRSLRFQGLEWPKVVLASCPSKGRYIPEKGCYDREMLDYFCYRSPYSDLYDVVLDNLWFFLGVCLPILEVEHLVHTTGVRKQWLLTDGEIDYGLLTFKRLGYRLSECPQAVCAFRAYSDALEPLLGSDGFPKAQRLWLRSMDQLMKVDEFLSDCHRFELFIVGEEARIRLVPKMHSDWEKLKAQEVDNGR